MYFYQIQALWVAFGFFRGIYHAERPNRTCDGCYQRFKSTSEERLGCGSRTPLLYSLCVLLSWAGSEMQPDALLYHTNRITHSSDLMFVLRNNGGRWSALTKSWIFCSIPHNMGLLRTCRGGNKGYCRGRSETKSHCSIWTSFDVMLVHLWMIIHMLVDTGRCRGQSMIKAHRPRDT